MMRLFKGWTHRSKTWGRFTCLLLSSKGEHMGPPLHFGDQKSKTSRIFHLHSPGIIIIFPNAFTLYFILNFKIFSAPAML